MHAFMIFPLIWRAPRPSDLSDMIAVYSKTWCPKGFSLTFFGHILTDSQRWAEHLNRTYDCHKNHEMIHLRQAQSTGNSWWLFYVKYLYFSLKAIGYWRGVSKAYYYMNPFEMEAYAHQDDLQYADRMKENGAEGWRRIANMNKSQKIDFLKKHGIGKHRI